MFLAAIWSSLCFSCSMYRFDPPLVVLAPPDSNVAVYAQVLLTVFCVFYMPLFGLVQARSWFRSSMWISSVAGISNFMLKLEKTLHFLSGITQTWVDLYLFCNQCLFAPFNIFTIFSFRNVPFRKVPFRKVTIHKVPFRKVPFRKVPFRKVPFRKVPFRFVSRSTISQGSDGEWCLVMVNDV